jgi:phage baseplate assembly protein W
MSSFGVSLPIMYDSTDGFQMLKKIRDVVKQNFKMLVLTNPGERVMEPDFGVGLKKYLFENYGHGTYQAIDTRIRKQVARYLPVVSINEINFGQTGIESNILDVSIHYTIPAIAESDLIEFTI